MPTAIDPTDRDLIRMGIRHQSKDVKVLTLGKTVSPIAPRTRLPRLASIPCTILASSTAIMLYPKLCHRA